MAKLLNIVNNFINGVEKLNYFANQIGIFYRPVGLLVKNSGLINQMLSYNLGNGEFKYDVGTPIKGIADINYKNSFQSINSDLSLFSTYYQYVLNKQNINNISEFNLEDVNRLITNGGFESTNIYNKIGIYSSLNNVEIDRNNQNYYSIINNNTDLTDLNDIIRSKSYLGRIVYRFDDNFVLNNDKTQYELKTTRIVFPDVGNRTVDKNHILITYAEAERDGVPYTKSNTTSYNEGINFGLIDVVKEGTDKQDIIEFTNQNFRKNKYKTLIARFATGDSDLSDIGLNTAYSKYGLSHGRNLLKKEPSIENGYSNPYCRVWTFHHQYSKLNNTIRPFDNDVNGTNTKNVLNRYRTQLGGKNLDLFGVRGSNNLVQIAPTNRNNIKRCMFSIENLAWKGENDDTINIGPLGGRIMWFPPYDISFNENVNVNWNSTQFIGRGENIYTYTNTERTGNLKFKMLIDHPSILDKWAKENTNGEGEPSDVDNIDSKEQQILRFFAGCEILDGTNKSQSDNEKKISYKPNQQIIKATENEINFFVYFPNDYSGINDMNSQINPIEYLLNGIGCNVNETQNLITSTLTDNYYKDSEKKNIVGGYEIRNNYGISLDDKNEDDKIIDTVYDKSGNEIKLSTITKGNINWSYRADNNYLDEVLVDGNYIDSKTYQLNGIGYKNITKILESTNKLISENKLFSFLDFYLALDSSNKNIFSSDLYNENNINVLKKLISSYNISNIEVIGYASSHGYTSNNIQLSKDRSIVIYNWLINSSLKFDRSCIHHTYNEDKIKLSKLDVNSLEAKLSRCAQVIIKLKTDNSDNLDIKNTNNETLYLTQLSLNSYDSKTNNNENEYDYFVELEKENPFLHNLITQKIKYFDPAFHSITPEGFNARLTFLHQCTRQGNTLVSYDNNNNVATNLAFGRPPICVLRIGDFYNTKIVINSLSIDYDDGTWDLNDEGIGVMPMIANINISFVFIGGSDLSGPISRLQNAISFNYYANTSVYDNRSDINIK